MLKEVKIDTIYKHVGNQKLYVVTGIGFHTELEEMTVRYIALYESEYEEYYRPLDNHPKSFKNRFVEASFNSQEKHSL